MALLYPRTECTRTDSVASKASSMNSKMALAASSRGSSKSCNMKIVWLAYLVVLIQPEESKVGDTDWLPVILNLFARAVDHMSDFVCNNEF